MINSAFRQSEDRAPTPRDDIMPSLMRITGWFSFIFGSCLFLIFQGRLDFISQIAGGVVLLSILAILMFTGNQKLISSPPKIITESKSENIIIPQVELDSEKRQEPVDSLNEEKLQRSRKKSSIAPPPLPPLPLPDATSMNEEATEFSPPLPNFGGINVGAVEGTKLAKKLVITSDAQSEMESEIENFVDQRRSRQAEIRSTLERKRRMALAERRAAKARLWTEVEDGEDLATLLNDPNHGLTILEESEEYDDSKPLGVSYVRIDNNRILKLTIPLVVESKKKETGQTKTDSLVVDTDIQFPQGLPPMPPPPGLPPMPPPPGLPPIPPPHLEKE
ncbi:MAG: hypothetical protein CMA38_03565 [Euryarchaeota archaeon]|jgi:hypothetical protein|uniref:Uncharacterized protein n=1 Tax=uncultured Poseidoniia archaeon TaxID=1697135 RepID=A0A0R7K3Z4_9ARCH|nr:hypothetical protein [uncultured Candidatus Thalassoarchaea sp.]MAS18467.1 hypothetical protein [Euryarchaeota archaeon]MDC0155693.1 hypothetical protein [Euryarchaeota archaeon]|tara:strand:- start:15140 stop:16141 length:1002 start_codon:yes stop_codon:yes gene_type:complete